MMHKAVHNKPHPVSRRQEKNVLLPGYNIEIGDRRFLFCIAIK